MKITYIGHACFVIEKDGYRVLIDPFEDGSIPGYSDVREDVNMVLCSHQHFDHNAVSCANIVEGGDCPFTITEIESYHDECNGAKRGPNTIRIFDDGVTKVAHLGDIGCDINTDMSEEERAMLTGLDAVMVPVGGIYTIDSEQAFELVKQLDPKIAIPMHFRSIYYEAGNPELQTEDEFINRWDCAAKLFKTSIDSESTPYVQVNVLRAQNCIKQPPR